MNSQTHWFALQKITTSTTFKVITQAKINQTKSPKKKFSSQMRNLEESKDDVMQMFIGNSSQACRASLKRGHVNLNSNILLNKQQWTIRNRSHTSAVGKQWQDLVQPTHEALFPLFCITSNCFYFQQRMQTIRLHFKCQPKKVILQLDSLTQMERPNSHLPRAEKDAAVIDTS